MLLAVDIGNSNIVLGGYNNDQLLFVARIRTDSLRTEFEYAVLIKDIAYIIASPTILPEVLFRQWFPRFQVFCAMQYG